MIHVVTLTEVHAHDGYSLSYTERHDRTSVGVCAVRVRARRAVHAHRSPPLPVLHHEDPIFVEEGDAPIDRGRAAAEQGQ